MEAGNFTKTHAIDMQSIADIAGVSKSTVSRALNDSPLVSEKTKQKIRDIAEQHNYVMNEAARNLRVNHSRIVTVVLMSDPLTGQKPFDPFFMEMIGNIAQSLTRKGLDMLLSHEPIENAKNFVAGRLYRQSIGIIVIGQGEAFEELNTLSQGKLPMVVWGLPLDNRDYPVVSSDDITGGEMATRHLLECGKRNIAFFGDKESIESEKRYKGYVGVLAENGLEPMENTVPFEVDRATQSINRFLDHQPTIDGIVCCSDLIAMTAISCLKEHGLKVPEDVAVVGYDGLAISERTSPTLTTISQNISERANTLVNQLVNMVKGREITDDIGPVSLIKRKSTG